MKLKRYVTETGWGSLSDIFEVHQIIISVFVYYLELERRRPKFNHRRLRQYLFTVTREEDPIKIQRESDTNRRTLDTSIQSLETLEPWKDKVENVSSDWRKDTSTHSVAVTQHAGFPWSFRGQIPRSRVQASSNVLLQRMNSNNNLNEIQLDFHSQILTIIQNNFMDALQCPNLKETHFER